MNMVLSFVVGLPRLLVHRGAGQCPIRGWRRAAADVLTAALLGRCDAQSCQTDLP
jgi:hypothetical protein